MRSSVGVTSCLQLATTSGAVIGGVTWSMEYCEKRYQWY